MLDPDPDEMNADPQPWWQSLLKKPTVESLTQGAQTGRPTNNESVPVLVPSLLPPENIKGTMSRDMIWYLFDMSRKF